MTIRHLPDRCWATDPATLIGDDERHPHYDTEADANRAITEARADYPELKATARQLAAPCWVIQCDGDCEVTLDEEGECFVMHFDSRQDAETSMASYEWKYVGEGAFPPVFCPEDAPEGGEVPPPCPAELEAAGQLKLPGVA